MIVRKKGRKKERGTDLGAEELALFGVRLEFSVWDGPIHACCGFLAIHGRACLWHEANNTWRGVALCCVGCCLKNEGLKERSKAARRRSQWTRLLGAPGAKEENRTMKRRKTKDARKNRATKGKRGRHQREGEGLCPSCLPQENGKKEGETGERKEKRGRMRRRHFNEEVGRTFEEDDFL